MNKNHQEARPSIYDYEDVRAYLRDMYSYLKSIDRKFSYRTFSKKAGFSSHTYLDKVLKADRKISLNSIDKFAKGFQLSASEKEFFDSLVRFSQAKNISEKKRYMDRMQHNKRYRKIKELEADQYEYFSKWYYPAVRELVTHRDFTDDPKWIADNLVKPITEKEAANALVLLFRLQLIERKENGKIVFAKGAVASAKQVHSYSILNFHQSMLSQALEACETMPAKVRDNSCIILSVTEEDMELIRKKILRFRRSLLSTFGGKRDDYDRVYQMSISLVPLSKKIKRKK